MSPSSHEQRMDYLFATANNSVMQQVAIFGQARRKNSSCIFRVLRQTGKGGGKPELYVDMSFNWQGTP